MTDAATLEVRRDTERLHRLNTAVKQLRQLHNKGRVHSGDLMCKETTRHLVKLGYAGNEGGSPSALSYVHITQKGDEFLEAVDELIGRPWDYP